MSWRQPWNITVRSNRQDDYDASAKKDVITKSTVDDTCYLVN